MNDWLEFASAGMQETVALSLVATIGYLLGRLTKSRQPGETVPGQIVPGERAAGTGRPPAPAESSADIVDASQTARQIETVLGSVRRMIAAHHTQIGRFQAQLEQLRCSEKTESWDSMRNEADALLAPTEELASNLSMAYEQIRQQSLRLAAMGNVGPRIPGLTVPTANFASALRRLGDDGENDYVLAMITFSSAERTDDITDREGPQQQGEGVRARELERLLQSAARSDDLVARLGERELALLLPRYSPRAAQDLLAGLRDKALQELGLVIRFGISQRSPRQEGIDGHSVANSAGDRDRYGLGLSEKVSV